MIELKNINKYFFKNKKNEVHVINDTTLSLPDKGLITILGESGSGKTTLLNVIGGLDSFDSGSLTIDGVKINNSNVDKNRNLNIGYIFQDYKLLDDLNVFDNVAISLKLCGMTNKEEIEKRVRYVLEVLGIYRYRKRLVSNLSGGERQRVGIARAIVKNPKIVICDEPTGNLDSRNSVEIMNIIKSISKERLVILVTHETNLAEFYSDRIIKIVDGKIISDEENSVKDELEYELDNKIYLKDLDHREELTFGDNEVNIFFDEKTKQKINIVIKGNNVYIESTSKNTEIIDNNRLQLVDDHKKKIDKSVYEKYEFKLDDFKKKNKSVLSFGDMIIKNLKTINSVKGIKKLIVITSLFASMFIFYSIAKIGKMNTFEENEYVLNSKNVVELDYDFSDKDRQNAVEFIKKKEKIYNDIIARDDVLHVFLGTNKTSSWILSDRFFQTYETDSVTVGDYALELIDFISKKDLVYGRMPEKANEVVIDKLVYERLCTTGYCYPNQVLSLGIVELKDMLDVELYTTVEDQTLKIVGIVDKGSPCVYFTEEGLSLGYVFNYSDTVRLERLKNATIVEGKLPEEDYDVVLPKSLMNEYHIGDLVNRDANKEYGGTNEVFRVVGFYEDSLGTQVPLFNKRTLFLLHLYDFDQIIIETKDKNKLMNEVSGDNFKLVDVVDRDLKRFKNVKQQELIGSIKTAAIAVLIVVVEIFFVLRTSLLSRVKEIGIYRSIGVNKFDLYKMFLGEIITLVSAGSITGAGVMFILFMRMKRYTIISSQFMINPLTLIFTLLIIYIITFLVTLLPIFFIVRKYPAQILTRKDV